LRERVRAGKYTLEFIRSVQSFFITYKERVAKNSSVKEWTVILKSSSRERRLIEDDINEIRSKSRWAQWREVFFFLSWEVFCWFYTFSYKCLALSCRLWIVSLFDD
jgi:hypothetical protein